MAPMSGPIAAQDPSEGVRWRFTDVSLKFRRCGREPDGQPYPRPLVMIFREAAKDGNMKVSSSSVD